MDQFQNLRMGESIKKDFPILQQNIHGCPLAYLDNAATTQKPQAVIDALCDFYLDYCSNVHRGLHSLSAKATLAYEEVREQVKQFINAEKQEEIIFTKGTTESINLVAQTFGRQNIKKGDEIIVSAMEHHSNIVPWQAVCKEKKASQGALYLSSPAALLDELMAGLG